MKVTGHFESEMACNSIPSEVTLQSRQNTKSINKEHISIVFDGTSNLILDSESRGEHEEKENSCSLNTNEDEQISSPATSM